VVHLVCIYHPKQAPDVLKNCETNDLMDSSSGFFQIEPAIDSVAGVLNSGITALLIVTEYIVIW